DRRAQPRRAGRIDRLFYQYAGAARRSLRQPERARAAPARARGGARRLRPPGPALREAGRGAPARAHPEPHAAVPGAVQPPEHAAVEPDAGRPSDQPARWAQGYGLVRPIADAL